MFETINLALLEDEPFIILQCVVWIGTYLQRQTQLIHQH